MNAAGSTTITVNTALFAAGDTVFIQNLGAGVCTVTAGTATVSTAGSLVLAQNQGGELYFTSASASIFFQYATPASSGDIEGVTAGTGISGGGTSGTVTVTNSMATAIDAKGDLIAGTGADAFSRLAVGTNGYLLTADSAEATGLKWAAAAGGGGKVLQVVEGTLSGFISTNSTTYASTGTSVSITPSLNTSKVLVFAVLSGVAHAAGNAQNCVGVRLMRDSTNIFQAGDRTGIHSHTATLLNIGSVQMTKLDSPATTSAITYSIQWKSNVSGQDSYANDYEVSDTTISTVVAMEIGA